MKTNKKNDLRASECRDVGSQILVQVDKINLINISGDNQCQSQLDRLKYAGQQNDIENKLSAFRRCV
jgi:hypothetical protein